MSKGISLGTLTGNGALAHQVEGYSASQYSLFIDGDYGSGNLAFEGSADGVTFVPIMVTNPADAGTTGHTALVVATNLGLYTFNALCAFLRFTLSGSTNPALELTLYPEPRS